VRARAWLTPAVAGVILALAYVSGPNGKYVAGFFTPLVPLVAALIARRRPNVPHGQLTWIAVAMALLTVRNWATRLGVEDGPWMSVLNVAALVALLIISSSLISLGWWRNRTGRRAWNFSAAVDAALILSGGAAAILCLVTLPYLSGTSERFLSSVTVTVVPLLDMVVVSAVAYLVFVSRERLPARWLILGSVILLFTFDMLRASSVQAGNLVTPAPANAALALAYGLLGAWALHPSMPLLGADQRVGASAQSWSVPRIVVLCLAVLAPVFLIALSPNFASTYLTVLVVANLVSTALLLLRSIRAVRGFAASQSELRAQAERDNLTGLANRSAFRAQVTDLLADAAAHEQTVSVIYLDLNGFKKVNDTLGHAVGDDLLIEVGTRLRSALRGDDRPARLGGDEFALAILDGRDAAAGRRVAQRMHEVFATPITLGGQSCDVSAAVGWSNTADMAHPWTGDALVDAADRAMYEAKRRGSAAPVRADAESSPAPSTT
jgi:diguanylate cyclase (GGDEF)-like protein